MHTSDPQLIPVFSRWIGSWQLRLDRRPLSPAALAARYDQAAPGWAAITSKYQYSDAYEHLLNSFLVQNDLHTGSEPLRALDAGVGAGAFSLALQAVTERPLQLTAIDISPAMLRETSKRFRSAHLPARLVETDIRELPFDDASFDLVLAAHVLEHLPDPATALREVHRVLRPGGWVVTCMTRRSLLGTYIQAKWRTHRLSGEQSAAWLRSAGFAVLTPASQPRGVFSLTSVTTIGQKANAGKTSQETQQ